MAREISKEQLPLLYETHQVVEDEDSYDTDFDVQPWDPDKIRISTKHFSLREVIEQIKDKDIDLSPDFQRDYVWSARQRTRLIESILLGIPLPAFYFNQESDGSYQIVDGVQRLTTVSLFMDDQHTLTKSDIEYLTHLDGFTFSKFGPLESRRFRSTQIVVHVIEPSTPPDIKYDIFSRVNTLGSPLKPQEIRHAMSQPRSRKFLKDLVESEEFDKATQYNFFKATNDGKVRDSARMSDRELALRFCAFKSTSLDIYKKYSGLDRFLVDATRFLDGKITDHCEPLSDSDLKLLNKSFKTAMRNAKEVLGEQAFRRIEPGKRRGPINRAIFESQAIALSNYTLKQVTEKKEEIKKILIGLFLEEDYSKAVTVGTGAPKAVQIRLEKPQKALKRILK
ncbi:DUF262 domain-containing protein [Serratia marcescens]|uniref:DUF262 domain-containing protein n=1 Tax=Serratia marcescens TaxID=615 RepID=UPI000EEE7755|nr:hypothetical protein CMV60_09505 [Serratia marcescens]HEI9811071.1 DUF262 domain-containing protein [Serratia marcescens]